MVVAQGIIAIGYALSPTLPSEKSRLVLPIFLALMGLFYVASRDTLAKYYDRASTLLHAANFKGEETMTNGFGMKHDEEIAKKTPARPAKTSRQDARKAKPQSSTTSVKR
jgi:hypothetical protein